MFSFYLSLRRQMSARVSLLTGCLLVGFVAGSLPAVEQFLTTADLVRTAPYVAVVRVESSGQVPGLAAREYELSVLENLKGRLPARIRMRVLSALRVVNPGGEAQPVGSEWLVFLGKEQPGGHYPLRSLQWGRIPVGTNAETGEQIVLKALTGFPPPAGGLYYRLDEFRLLVRELLRGGSQP